MKYIMFLCVICSLFLVSACATSSYSGGKDFNSENVSNIVKGETTKEELVQLFGQPYSKSVISSTGEKWIYTYFSGTASAQSYVVTMNVESTGMQKTLDILIEDGVVTNFTYTESPMPNTKM